MALGSDAGFYGNFGLGGGYGGQFQPWQIGQGAIGQSAYNPQTADLMPSTLSGFAQQYIPELAGASNLSGRFGSGLQEQFRDFRFGGDVTQKGIYNFQNQLLQSEQAQQLLREQELRGSDAFLRGQEGGRGLSDVVGGLLGEEGSQLANLYGGTGFGTEAVTADIQRFIGGQQSALGGLSAGQLLGGSGSGTGAESTHTQGSRNSVLASLFSGSGLVGLGGGRSFNPFSQDIPDYGFQAGVGGAIQGNDLLSMTGGLLSLTDANITGDIASAFGRAQETGASFGMGGGDAGHLWQSIGRLNLEPGQEVTQFATSDEGHQAARSAGYRHLGQWLDKWYANEAGSDFHRDFGGLFGANRVGGGIAQQLGMNIQGGV